MTIALHWNRLSINEWEDRFASVPRSNILQSYTYARAWCPYARQKARWGLIEIDGKEAGLIQVFEAGIFRNAFHALTIDRGPVWFEGAGTALHLKRVLEELNAQFPVRWGRRRRIMPELEESPSALKMISQWGYTRIDRPGYQTVWLDLFLGEDTLRAGLEQKWRNRLNKAERAGLKIDWDISAPVLSWLTGIYAGDKAARGYGGPEPAFLRRYLPLLAAKGDLIVARAIQDSSPIAFNVLVCHGRSATYLAGWSSEAGRENSAHHLLLWEGIKMLKQKGIMELDLGGVNDEEGQGIKHFKEGLGGRTVRLVGHYV